jgi:hypothetical protein
VRPSVCPKKVLLLSAPSTTRLLSVPRWPAKLISPVRTSRVTPGVSSAKSMKFRPLTGRLAMATTLTVELICDRVVSTDGVVAPIGPRTVTVSATPAGLSSMRTVTVCPIVTVRLRASNGANPDRLAFTV